MIQQVSVGAGAIGEATDPETGLTHTLLQKLRAEGGAQMGGFTGGGLSGPLPDNLAAFPAISFLDLSGNMLTGTLPSRLPPTLVDFRVSYNFLTGTIPSAFGASGSIHLRNLFFCFFSFLLSPPAVENPM